MHGILLLIITRGSTPRTRRLVLLTLVLGTHVCKVKVKGQGQGPGQGQGRGPGQGQGGRGTGRELV